MKWRRTTETSLTLREDFGVGAHTAAELLIIFGDNSDRMRDPCANALPTGQVVAEATYEGLSQSVPGQIQRDILTFEWL